MICRFLDVFRCFYHVRLLPFLLFLLLRRLLLLLCLLQLLLLFLLMMIIHYGFHGHDDAVAFSLCVEDVVICDFNCYFWMLPSDPPMV